MSNINEELSPSGKTPSRARFSRATKIILIGLASAPVVFLGLMLGACGTR